MYSTVCLIIALMMIAVFGLFACKNRHSTKECIAAITLGVFFATFFMVLPTQWVKEGKSVENPQLYAILSSLLYSFKALTGRQDIGQLETIGLEGTWKTAYIYITYVMFVLAPVLASGLIMTFIGDTGEKLRYWLSWSPKCYVFSELNESSLSVAESAKRADGRKTIVFCNTKKVNERFVEDARKIGAILLHKTADHLHLSHRFKKYEFYFLAENEDNNIALTESFILKKEKIAKHDVVINAFAENKTNISVMESMISKKPCAVFESTHETLVRKAITITNEAPKTQLVFFNVSNADEEFERFVKQHSVITYEGDWESTEVDSRFGAYDMTLYRPAEKEDEEGNLKTVAVGNGLGYRKNRLVTQWQETPLKIRFIDEIALFCYNQLFEHPLYDLPEGRKDISVLLVGCGRLGMRMLKTVCWCGQIVGYTLKIRVLDKMAKTIEKELDAQCPELRPNYDIAFEDVDVESDDFETKIKANADATFVCVATGSDELNISTAENIYRILRRNYCGYLPPIFTRVRKMLKSKNFEEKGSFLDERKIRLFGTTASIFSNHTLFNSNLENLALAVHLCYNWALEQDKDSFDYKKALNDFCTSEYARRSSMAAALHIGAKFRGCNTVTSGAFPTEDEVAEFAQRLQDETVAQTLMENEHERWNAFMRSEGFRSVDFGTVRKYAPETRSHKDEVAKLHPCIVSWKDLNDLQEKYNALQKELTLKKSDFKEYDKKIVTEIPKIIQRANELCKEGW